MLTTGPTALRWCSHTVSLWVLHGLVRAVHQADLRYRRLVRLGRLGSIHPSYTLGGFAARCSTQTPRGVSTVTGEGSPAPSRRHRNGRDTIDKPGRKGTSRRQALQASTTPRVGLP